MPFSADEAFDLLKQSRARGRFAQAYLITGAPGAGKRQLLERLAATLLGEKKDPLKHPDVHSLEPQMKSRVIGIEAMQELISWLQMRSLVPVLLMRQPPSRYAAAETPEEADACPAA